MVERVGADQLVQQRHEQRAIGPRLDRDPLVGDGRVTGAHRVDADEAPARALELRQRHLHRVAVMVFRGADHHEQLGALQVGPAELPEAAADGVDHAGGHVHRAEAAVRRIVGRAELAREQPGQRLHLVAPGEQRKLLRVGRADLLQPLGQQLEGALPADGLELTRATLAAGLAQQRPGQPRRRHLLHDAGGTLGADHALVQRVIRVAVDVAHLRPVVAFAQVHADAATAGAHVAGGALHLRGRARRRVGQRVVQRLAGQELEHAASFASVRRAAVAGAAALPAAALCSAHAWGQSPGVRQAQTVLRTVCARAHSSVRASPGLPLYFPEHSATAGNAATHRRGCSRHFEEAPIPVPAEGGG